MTPDSARGEGSDPLVKLIWVNEKHRGSAKEDW